MNNVEAKAILEDELRRYRARSYSELVELLDEEYRAEMRGPSGATYQVEVQLFWDDQPNGELRVMGSIDDGGWRAFIPLTDGFVLAPNGTIR